MAKLCKRSITPLSKHVETCQHICKQIVMCLSIICLTVCQRLYTLFLIFSYFYIHRVTQLLLVTNEKRCFVISEHIVCSSSTMKTRNDLEPGRTAPTMCIENHILDAQSQTYAKTSEQIQAHVGSVQKQEHNPMIPSIDDLSLNIVIVILYSCF